MHVEKTCLIIRQAAATRTGCSVKRAYQAVAVERGVNGAEEEPARPQVFQPELQNKVCQKHHDPHGHELQERVCARTREGKDKTQNKPIEMAGL